jgi:hypothetical protein
VYACNAHCPSQKLVHMPNVFHALLCTLSDRGRCQQDVKRLSTNAYSSHLDSCEVRNDTCIAYIISCTVPNAELCPIHTRTHTHTVGDKKASSCRRPSWRCRRCRAATRGSDPSPLRCMCPDLHIYAFPCVSRRARACCVFVFLFCFCVWYD